jgi:hypothetical protein
MLIRASKSCWWCGALLFNQCAQPFSALNVQSNRPGVRELKIIMNKFAPKTSTADLSVSYLHIHLDTRAQFIIRLIILLFGARGVFPNELPFNSRARAHSLN